MMAKTTVPVNDFYTRRIRDYLLASPELREKSKRHWLECYADELAKGRFDEHSARVIANMALVDAGLVTLTEEAA